MPGLVSRGVGELIGAGYITTGKNMREIGLQKSIGFDRFIGIQCNPNLFQPESLYSWVSTGCDQYSIKGYRFRILPGLHRQSMRQNAFRLVRHH